jgi:tetraacyldisaccharide 4'-kinase
LQGGAVLPLHYLQGRRVYAVAGIGHPERFFVLLQSLGAEVEPKAFLDHHAFEATDFSGFENEFIVMTEKDAVKCQHLKLPQAVFLEITANMTPVFARAILEKIQYTLPHEYRTKNEPLS